ncbi:alpha,alpha-trehalose-phosphate synthase (UDP-forming) [Paracoccus albus]|uniref:alpha,alpha-trehalose-phosphate synthase (UDP-forming) n=1 Tax=Paracoccus albus TaxID=3017784 RepID=UPI0022F06720|nr:trehalose-6-phosphate synthase [Paracoccus albus]WBU61136.1 trehalose-6-phosphate synthase [Paracoccus albus]
MHRLVAVSNRLPLCDNPSGGLVVALQDALSNSGGLWIGFSGEQSEDPAETLTFHDGARFQRASFDLSEEDFDSYYLGYSNSVLWPAFHGRADLIEIDPVFLDGYRRVSEKIARMMVPHLKEDDRIWIQDYQLIPLAAALRKLGVTNRIGFFLHIPFPDPATCAALPNPKEMFEWLSQYDLIGFQAQRDVRNFTESAAQLAEIEMPGDDVIRLCQRETRAGAFPIGIDAAGFMGDARKAREEDRMRSLTNSKMMIGVDRLDYSKGIPQRFRAFQLLLENNPDLTEKVMLLQIAPPTRESVEAYQDIREETEHLAGRINGQFATVNWTPIRFIHRPIPRHELAGLYRQANVGLVTPLADGMNLVAKEYVAAQDVANPGVLILSRFAGAAETMDEALIVNPHDPWDMADAMKRAINMTSNERRRRHSALLQNVVESDVAWWADNYLKKLG